MPWRLIAFITILGLVVIFAGFNINNSSDVSFGFAVVEEVPIFISLFFAFVVGVVVMVPFVIGRTRKRRSPKKGEVTGSQGELPQIPDIPADHDEERPSDAE